MTDLEREQFKMNILIVDDDKKLCRLVSDYLAPMGYRVEAVKSGEHALERPCSQPTSFASGDTMSTVDAKQGKRIWMSIVDIARHPITV